jgi:glycine oxidase
VSTQETSRDERSEHSLPELVDVLIVGSGTVGASAAFHLARSGARVLVIDQANPPGAGSRAGAGICVPSVRLLDDPPMLAFARAGQRVLLDDLARLDPATSAQPGLLRPVTSHAQASQLAVSAGPDQDLLGSWLERDQVAELEPGLKLGDIVGAFYDPSARVLHAPGYVGALADRAAAAGATLVTDTVGGLDAGADAVVVRTTRGPVRADRVILAAGAWTSRLPGAPQLPVVPVRGHVLRLGTGANPRRPRHIVSGPLFIGPAANGPTTLVGATEERAGFAPGPTPDELLLLAAHVVRNWPGLRGSQIVESWSGYRAGTPDGRPFIGPVPDSPRVLVATGHGGQGLLTGSFTGQLIAELLLTGRPNHDLAPFALDRATATPAAATS